MREDLWECYIYIPITWEHQIVFPFHSYYHQGENAENIQLEGFSCDNFGPMN